ncbi:MAG: hypothetical protein KKH32_06570 [Bacteroidetes bacterium]|nr:hypothetical protein [Bacteroidota bacterium]
MNATKMDSASPKESFGQVRNDSNMMHIIPHSFIFIQTPMLICEQFINPVIN